MDMIGILCRHAFRIFDQKSLQFIAYKRSLGFNKLIDKDDLHDGDSDYEGYVNDGGCGIFGCGGSEL